MKEIKNTIKKEQGKRLIIGASIVILLTYVLEERSEVVIKDGEIVG